MRLWRLTIQTDNPHVAVLVTPEVAKSEIGQWAAWSALRKQAADEAAESFNGAPQDMSGILVRQVYGLYEDDDEMPAPKEGEQEKTPTFTLRQTLIAYRFEDVIGMSACDTGMELEESRG